MKAALILSTFLALVSLTSKYLFKSLKRVSTKCRLMCIIETENEKMTKKFCKSKKNLLAVLLYFHIGICRDSIIFCLLFVLQTIDS